MGPGETLSKRSRAAHQLFSSYPGVRLQQRAQREEPYDFVACGNQKAGLLNHDQLMAHAQ